MKATIVHVITEFASGGAERVLTRVVAGSTAFRHFVVTLTGKNDGPLARDLRALGIEVISLDMRPSAPSPLAILRLARIIRRERPVLVQTWLYHADLIGLLAALFTRFRPVVWNLRCSDMDLSRYRWSTRIVVRLLTWLSPMPAAVIANSQAGRRWHDLLGYRPAGWEIVPNGVDTATFRPDAAARVRWRRQLGLTDETILVGCLARRDPMKDHEGLLLAAAEAAHQRSNLAFVLAGRGVTRADATLARLADRVGAPVQLIGECEDPAGLTAALDIAVLPSFGEGFPNVVAEAMAAGVPCIVTDVGDAARIVADTGIVVPPRDPAALSRAIVALAADAPLRAKLGQAALRRITDVYGITGVIAQYEKIWREIVASQQKHAQVASAGPSKRDGGLATDISVVIPVYNRAQEIGRTVTSALRQTLPPKEIIVVDDGSTDSTWATLSGIRDPRLRLIRHPRNLGAAAARNSGVSASTATWIAFLDSDDEWAPEKLARQLKSIGDAPSSTVASITGFTLYDHRYGTCRVFHPTEHESTTGALAWGCRVSPGSTLLVQRRVFFDVGPFDTQLNRFEDWDWLIRFGERYTLIAESDPLAIIHKSCEPAGSRAAVALALIKNKHRAAFRRHSWLEGRRFDSTILIERAACAYYERHYAKAVSLLLHAITIYPFRNAAFFRVVLKRAMGILSGQAPSPPARGSLPEPRTGHAESFSSPLDGQQRINHGQAGSVPLR